MNERNYDQSRAIVRRRRVDRQISEMLVERTSLGNASREFSARSIHDKIVPHRSRVRRKFQMVGSCRGLRRHLSLRASTCRDRPLQYRGWACWAMASPMGGQFDQTTLRAPNFSLAK